MEQALDKQNTEREKGIYRVTVVGSIVNFLLLVFKFFAAFFGHSAAMLADAVHSLSDFVTDIIVIVFVRISAKPEDESHDYGHGKYETLATAIIGILLLFVGFGILWSGASSIYRFLQGDSLQEPGILALAAALISIVSKEVLYRYTVFKGKKLNSQAVIANAWHHRSDALSSIGTAIGIGGAILLLLPNPVEVKKDCPVCWIQFRISARFGLSKRQRIVEVEKKGRFWSASCGKHNETPRKDDCGIISSL